MTLNRHFCNGWIGFLLSVAFFQPGKLLSQDAAWIQGFTGTPFFSETELDAVATKSDGSVVVAGEFYGDLQVGSGDEVIDIVAPNFNDYIFLASFGPDGLVQWVHTLEVTDLGEIHALAIDHDDNIYACGYFEGNLDFSDLGMSLVITSTDYGGSSSGGDGVVFKLSSEGDYLWHSQFEGNAPSSADAITTTSDDKIIVAISFQADLTLSDATSDTLLFALGQTTANAIAEYTGQGEYVQVITVQGDQIGGVFGLAEDEAGQRYAVGYYLGEKVIETNGGSITLQAPPAGSSYGSYLFKYNAIGEVVWVREIHGLGQENAWLVEPASDGGSVYVAGFFSDNLYVADANGQDTLTSNGLREMFVLSFDADGELLWSRSMGGAGDDLIFSLQAIEGGFSMLGSVVGEVFFDQNNTEPTFDAPYFGFGLAGYDAAGNIQWSYFRTGDGMGTAEVNASAMSADGGNNHFLIGGGKNINFGTELNPITFEHPAGSSFGYRYLLRMQAPIISSGRNLSGDVNFSLFPVPAQDEINVRLTIPGTHTIEIRNMQGQVMDRRTVLDGINTFDLTRYAAGAYIMLVYTESGWGYAERFIAAK